MFCQRQDRTDIIYLSMRCIDKYMICLQVACLCDIIIRSTTFLQDFDIFSTNCISFYTRSYISNKEVNKDKMRFCATVNKCVIRTIDKSLHINHLCTFVLDPYIYIQYK